MRRAKTLGDRKKIEEIREKTETIMKEYQEKMITARQEAFQMKAGIRKEGERQGQKIIQEARQASLAQIDKIKKEIEGASQKATTELELQAEALSQQVAEKVLGRPLNS